MSRYNLRSRSKNVVNVHEAYDLLDTHENLILRKKLHVSQNKITKKKLVKKNLEKPLEKPLSKNTARFTVSDVSKNSLPEDYTVHKVPEDGHCMFSSIAMILFGEEYPVEQGVVRKDLSRFLDEFLRYTWGRLQEIEYMEHDRIHEDWYKKWKKRIQLFKKRYPGFDTDNVLNGTLDDFVNLYKQGLETNMWGDLRLLRFAQVRYKIGFRVISKDGTILAKESDCFPEYGILMFDNNHYQPISSDENKTFYFDSEIF